MDNTNYINPNANFFKTPQVPDVINSTVTSNVPTLNLPTTPQDTTDYKSVISSIPPIENITTPLTQTIPQEQTNQSIIDKILSLTGKQKTQGEIRSQYEEQYGLTKYSTQLDDINAQMQNLKNEAEKISLETGKGNIGRGVIQSNIANMTTDALRDNYIKTLNLSSIANVLQGRIATAQRQVEKATEAQFGNQQRELDSLKTAYALNKDILDRQDKKKSDLLNIQLQERQRLLDQAKDDKKVILGFVAEAAKNGAPTTLLNQVSSLNNPMQALQTLGGYMSDPIAKEKALEEIALIRANKNKIIADTQKTNAEKAKILAETKVNTTTAKAQLQNNEALTLAKELRKPDAVGKSGAVGFALQKLVPFGQGLGLQPARASFEAKVNTLKSNLTLDNLKLLKGAMSDKDLLFLNSIGSSLDTNMKEEEFDKELDRIIKKLEDAGATSGTEQQTVTSQGQTYVVGQVYQDASGKNWVVDAQGNWSQQ